MLITTYTSYQSVRLVVGMASDELSDTLLADEIYAATLSLALDSVVVPATVGTGTLKAEYATVALLAENARTLTQQKLYDLTRLFSAYVVGDEVCNSLASKLPKVKADGKASFGRFAPEATFRDVVQRVREMRASLKYAIENLGSTASFIPTLCGIITPEIDVVTGE